MMPIRSMPQAPEFIRGVVNLRGEVIPVMDLRLRFGLEARPYTDRTCIIVLDVQNGSGSTCMGVIVDAVSEVNEMKAADIEGAGTLSGSVRTSSILGMAKQDGEVKILLDMERVLGREERAVFQQAASA